MGLSNIIAIRNTKILIYIAQREEHETKQTSRNVASSQRGCIDEVEIGNVQRVVHTTTTTTTMVGGCLSGIIFGRSRGIKSIDDNHNHMYLWFTVESGCDGLWYTFIGSVLCVVSMYHHERTLRPKHVQGNYFEQALHTNS